MMLAHAEQIRAVQQLTDEQVGQMVRQTRSRTKAHPSRTINTSKAPSSSSSIAAAVRRARRAPAAVIVAR